MRMLIVLAALIGPLVLNSAAQASLSVGDVIVVKDVLANGFGGGAFGIALKSDPNNVLFNTFCLEKNEHLNYVNPVTLKPNFKIDSISAGATNGGEGGQTTLNYDPLDARTAWLYYEYATGNLSMYDGSATKEKQLQNAIWRIENESYNNSDSTLYYNLAVAAAGGADPDFAAKVSRVRVLNISWNEGGGSSYPTGTKAQSLLYVIPEASTIAVWSILSLVGAGVAYRKRAGK